MGGHIPKLSSKRNSEVTFYEKEELVKREKRRKRERDRSQSKLESISKWMIIE